MDRLPEHPASPWHAGERALQERFNVAERLAVLGRQVIRDYMPEQHREFFQQLPFMVVGAVDADNRPWATLLEGPEGFVTSADPQHLFLAAHADPQDPAAAGLRANQAIGLLGIELHTRRRNRMNGVIRRVAADGFEVMVEQSYGNCPKYIQERSYARVPPPADGIAPRQDFSTLDERTRALIRAADTFFVASYIARDRKARAVDVSHRGGRAGFIKVEGNRLTIPDYPGNRFFNTLGNLQTNPVAGLLFIDFTTGDLLQLTGRTELLLDSPSLDAFEGAERLWAFEVEQAVLRPGALAIRWQFHGYAPTSLATGTWAEADQQLHRQAQHRQWQSWRVTHVQQESRDIRSFFLEPPDGAVVPFAAGQHLPIRIHTAEGDALLRTYSVSSAPSDGYIRISVKRQGRASAHLHDKLRAGDLLEVRPPLGNFTLHDDSERPVVLLSAGVGITPLISMARERVAQNRPQRKARAIHLFQSARTLADLSFQRELSELQQRSNGLLHIHRALSIPGSAQLERDYQMAGRLDFAQVKARLPLDDYDFYLCGPAGFLQDMYDGLRSVNIPDQRIHAEAFGPSALRRAETGRPPAQSLAASASVPVHFRASATEAHWTPDSGSLLELAESRGLNPEFSCRGGSCGTCSTRLISGSVHYPTPPALMPASDQVLICCAVPAQSEGDPQPLVLDL